MTGRIEKKWLPPLWYDQFLEHQSLCLHLIMHQSISTKYEEMGSLFEANWLSLNLIRSGQVLLYT